MEEDINLIDINSQINGNIIKNKWNYKKAGMVIYNIAYKKYRTKKWSNYRKKINRSVYNANKIEILEIYKN